MNVQKSIVSPYTSNEQSKKEITKAIAFIMASKNKILRNKFNKKEIQALCIKTTKLDEII